MKGCATCVRIIGWVTAPVKQLWQRRGDIFSMIEKLVVEVFVLAQDAGHPWGTDIPVEKGGNFRRRSTHAWLHGNTIQEKL